jgi:putative transposase
MNLSNCAFRGDGAVSVAPLIERCRGRFGDLIETEPSAEAVSALRAAETIGRPLGSPAFLDRLAAATGRDPCPKRRGPKPKAGRVWELSKASP